LSVGQSFDPADRRAKFYRLTAAGCKRLRDEKKDWNRVVGIMAAALKA